MREITYSKTAKNLIRLFCLLGIIVESLYMLHLFWRNGFALDLHKITNLQTFLTSELNTVIVNSVSLIFFIIFLFFPQYFVIFSIISYLYSFKIIIVDTIAVYPIGQLLYLMGTACLVFLGFYRYKRLPKIIITITTNYILIFFSLRFGREVLINSLITAIGYTLVFFVTLFFSASFFRFLYGMKHARVWDLSQYPELTKRDKEWLKQILEEKRYEEIATDSGITVGTLKNRMHQIFNIVGVDDRISLLASYGGYEVKF